jgi:chromosome segregation ATPase
MPDQLPVQCALDRSLLEDVAKKVDKISGQMDSLESRTGPIAAHELKLESLEGVAARAHERLDEHRQELEELKRSNTAIQVRLGVVLVPIASAIGAVVAKLL